MQYRLSLLILLSWFSFGCGNGQNNQQKENAISGTKSTTQNITIVNWNIEWFGSTKNGPYDLDLQQANVQKILQYLHAELYGLCEVVDIDRLNEVVHQLGDQYSCIVSDYAAGAKSGNTQTLKDAQKMAFVFDKNIFKNVHTRAFMQKSSRAGYNFSNGRYPFLLEATIQQNGKDFPIAVLLIHAKSGADKDSYNRRLQAANEMADSIKVVLNDKPLMIMGDYNDVLQNSIAGKNLTSPYSALLQNGNTALTLQLSPASGGTTLHYPTIIDNQIINSALAAHYVKGSIAIRKDIVNAVSDFKNGKTSDHYPISSSFDFIKTNSANTKTPNTEDTQDKNITINPKNNVPVNTGNFVQVVTTDFQDAIEISVSERQENLQFILYNSSDEKVLSVHRRYIEPGKSFFLKCKELSNGNYTLVVFENGKKNVFQVKKN